MKPTTRSLIKYRGEKCMNCGVPLDREDKYCHQCGQLNSTKKLALQDFFSEFFSNVFSYDSRIWRTIKHLMFKPGYVSKQFINGKRLSYANPFRFFLSVCIAFFLMVQAQELIGKYTDDQIEKAVEEANEADAEETLEEGLAALDPNQTKNLKDLTEEDLAKLEQDSYVGKFVAKQIRKEQAALNEKEGVENPDKNKESKEELEELSQEALDSLSGFEGFFKQSDHYSNFYDRTKIADPDTALKRMGHLPTKYNKSIYEKVVLMQGIGDDPGLLAEIILPKLPLFLFLFTPLLTLFFWFLYMRRSFTYMEHLIFAFNTLTFVFLSFILILLIKWLSWGYVNLSQFFFWFIGPFYMYKAMRNFYGQRRFKTFVKFLLVSFIFFIGLMIGLSLLLLVGIVLY